MPKNKKQAKYSNLEMMNVEKQLKHIAIDKGISFSELKMDIMSLFLKDWDKKKKNRQFDDQTSELVQKLVKVNDDWESRLDSITDEIPTKLSFQPIKPPAETTMLSDIENGIKSTGDPLLDKIRAGLKKPIIAVASFRKGFLDGDVLPTNINSPESDQEYMDRQFADLGKESAVI